MVHLPDLLVEWNDELPIGSAVAGYRNEARYGVLGKDRRTRGDQQGSPHRGSPAGGAFIAAGKGIRPGRMDRPVSLMDLAPTFTSCSGSAARRRRPADSGNPRGSLTPNA